jgi:hypothetical protein
VELGNTLMEEQRKKVLVETGQYIAYKGTG